MTVKLQYRLHLILVGIPGLYCQESNTSHQLCRHQNESPLILWFFQLMMWTVFIHSLMINCKWIFCRFIWLYYIEFSKYVIVLQRTLTSSPMPLLFDAFYIEGQFSGFDERFQQQIRITSGSVPILRAKKYHWISPLFRSCWHLWWAAQLI